MGRAIGIANAIGFRVGSKVNQILNIFSDIPQSMLGGYYYQDISGYDNHAQLVNLQSLKIKSDTSDYRGLVNLIDFSSVSSVTIKSKFIWNDLQKYYMIRFGGELTTKGFYLRKNSGKSLNFGVSNGVNYSNQNIDISSINISDGDVCEIEAVLSLGTTSINVNGTNVYLGTFNYTGNFGVPSSQIIWHRNGSPVDIDVIYIELIGYFKIHHKEGSGTTLYDCSGNGNNFEYVNGIPVWESYYGDYPAEFINGFTINSGVIVLGIDAKTEDSQGNAIQYPAGSGFVDGLSAKIKIPVDADLNTIIPAGDYSWSEVDSLAESSSLVKTKIGSQITSLIAKKKVNSSMLFSDYTYDSFYTFYTKY